MASSKERAPVKASSRAVAHSSASRKASCIPWAVMKSLWSPASPTRAQPGPKSKASVSMGGQPVAVSRSMTRTWWPGGPAASRSATRHNGPDHDYVVPILGHEHLLLGVWMGAGWGRRSREVSGRSPTLGAEVLPGGVGGRFGPVAQAELGQQVPHMGLDRLAGDEEPLGDLRVGQAGPDQRQDLGLALGQRAGPLGAGPHRYPQ